MRPHPVRPSPARRAAAAALLATTPLGSACRPAARPDAPPADAINVPAAPGDTGARRLPTGQRLDPAGRQTDVLPMPLAMLPTPDGRGLVLLGSGWRAQGVQLVDRATGRVAQTLEQPSAFVGLAFAPAGAGDGDTARTVYASGGNGDVVYRYRWSAAAGGAGRLALRDSLVLARRARPRDAGTRYPAGLAVAPDGRRVYVAENLGDALAVVDARSGQVVQRLATERYPYGVAVTPTGRVFVSAWGGRTVSVFDPAPAGDSLARVRDVAVARHPSALLLDRAGARLFVASASTDRVVVLDPRTLGVTATLADPPPAPAGGPPVREGSTPAALALSPDERRLYVAESDNNAVAAFELGAPGGRVPNAAAPALRVPVGWYPTAVAVLGDTLYSADGKGRGTAANPDGPRPAASLERRGSPANTTLRQIGGTLTAVPLGAPGGPALGGPALAARVARANGWDAPPRAAGPAYPPFEHVVYVIKENRTYDQVLGDLPQADGDTALLFFPRAVTPNHHALAERFGIYDRFFVNAEVSPDGHNWSVGAYATDYLQKTVPSNYSGRGRSYDYEGTNRGFGAASIPADDVAEPANGYLWNLVQARGLTFRNYGEFVVPPDAKGPLPAGYRGNKPFLEAHTNPAFPGYDLAVPDQRRADVWIAELGEFVRRGAMPALSIVRLPNDHTAGARSARPRRAPTWPTTTSHSAAWSRRCRGRRSGARRRCSSSRTTRRTAPTTWTRTARRCSSSRRGAARACTTASPTPPTCWRRSRRSSASARCPSSTPTRGRCARCGPRAPTCGRTPHWSRPSRSPNATPPPTPPPPTRAPAPASRSRSRTRRTRTCSTACSGAPCAGPARPTRARGG
jgi:YVTN family beta-propeller protein